MLDERGGIQWPYPGSTHADPAPAAAAVRRRPVLSSRRQGAVPLRPAGADARSRRANGIRCCCSPAAARPRSGTRKRGPRKSAVLRKLYPPRESMSRSTRPTRGGPASSRTSASSSSRSAGSLVAKAFVTHTVQPGQVFLPMHYEATNRLTLAHFDPHSRQPSYKNCAVRVRPRKSARTMTRHST